MSENSAKNKRIAKNTLVLYMRMLVTMAVSLYTSRVVLEALGVEDYGIYNVVGGVVGMFTLVSSSLSAAISRFITFELGAGNKERLKLVFSTSVIIQIILSAIIVILVESVGVWFLANKLVIPADRMVAAHWVLQLSLLTLVLGMVSMPYNAAIIAHEKMSAFAYMSILDVAIKLAIAYVLTIYTGDVLILYACLLCGVSLLMRVIYGTYSNRNFEECQNFKFIFERNIFKEMFGFAGWNFIGTTASLLRGQGVSMILNILGGGPVINAAKGVADQVCSAVGRFSSSFMTALNPQITKSYASGDRDYMMTLIFQGARLSFFLILFLSLPILMNTSYILSLWLKEVPNHTVLFVQLTFIYSMIEALSNPLITAQLATGNIKNYQLVVGGLLLLNFPLSYVCLKVGLFPEVVILVSIFVSLCCLAARLFMLRGMIGLSSISYLKNVFLNVTLVSAASVVIPYILKRNMGDNFVDFIAVSAVCGVSTMFAIYFVGCNKSERRFVNGKVLQFVDKIFK